MGRKQTREAKVIWLKEDGTEEECWEDDDAEEAWGYEDQWEGEAWLGQPYDEQDCSEPSVPQEHPTNLTDQDNEDSPRDENGLFLPGTRCSGRLAGVINARSIPPQGTTGHPGTPQRNPELFPAEENIGAVHYDPSCSSAELLENNMGMSPVEVLPDLHSDREHMDGKRMRAKKRVGHQHVTVCKESLQPGAGAGLFAYKRIRFKGHRQTRVTNFGGRKVKEKLADPTFMFECVPNKLWIDGDPTRSFGPWINHSTDECKVNAQVHYEPRTGVATVWATRDIAPGEEVLIFYGLTYFDNNDPLPADQLQELQKRRENQKERAGRGTSSNINKNNSYYPHTALKSQSSSAVLASEQASHYGEDDGTHDDRPPSNSHEVLSNPPHTRTSTHT